MEFNEEKTYREGIKSSLEEILSQVKRTNGRVSNLERWQAYVIGFCSCISLILLPILYLLIKGKI